jgi:hypothetical protein
MVHRDFTGAACAFFTDRLKRAKLKTREPSNENPSAHGNRRFQPLRLSPRQTRTLRALLAVGDGWISRERIDGIASASNGAQIISELRRKLTGDDGLEMQRRDAIDRNGMPCKPGY